MAKSRKPARDLSPDVEKGKELFLHAMAGAKPLRGRASAAPPPAMPKKPARVRKAVTPRPPCTPKASPPLRVKGRAALSAMDGRNAERFAKGKMEIEARLDLHGCKADEAERVLKDFIRRNHGYGKRCVLVITGTGRRGRENAKDQSVGARFVMPERRGVLFNLVPAWLGVPELRPYVVAFTPAQPKHGGSGALYVYLRRSRGQV